jgi:hypothetical protein
MQSPHAVSPAGSTLRYLWSPHCFLAAMSALG